ncbi:MAG: serine/threonine-protein kinase, partial [Syntrophomonadaceae bacterium]
MNECPACGGDILDDSIYCHMCGASTSGELTGKLSPDSILEGRYIIVKTIGRGGMGAVYLALDQRLDNILVAIKEMSSNAVGGNLQAAIAAFKKEASMLTRLRHPALPRISDFFAKGENRWYLVMDFIKGQTLKEVMDHRGPIPETEVIDWGIQLSQILHYLHTLYPPVIFRDLKPSNIMLTPDGQLKLIDFGIARHFHQSNSADTSAYGSHGFAPPEQYGQNQTDERSDIYALGATLHYLLTGIDPAKNPFNFEPPGKMARVSPGLNEAVMKAVALKPADRPQSISEFLNLLLQAAPDFREKAAGEDASPSRNIATASKTRETGTAPSGKLKPDDITVSLMTAETIEAGGLTGSGTGATGTLTLGMEMPGRQAGVSNSNPPPANRMMEADALRGLPANPNPVNGSSRAAGGGKSRKVILAACLAAALIGAGVYGFEHNNNAGGKSVQVASSFSVPSSTDSANQSSNASNNAGELNEQVVDRPGDVAKEQQNETTPGAAQSDQSINPAPTPVQGSQTTSSDANSNPGYNYSESNNNEQE